MRLRHGWAWLLLGACGGGAQPSAPDGGSSSTGSDAAAQATSLALLIGGGQCSTHNDCWRSYAFENGVLTASDAAGEERWSLSAREAADLEALARSPELREALRDPESQACGQSFDAQVELSVAWSDGSTAKAVGFAGCLDDREASDHIYNRLYWQLNDLAHERMMCPPKQIPPGWQPGVDPLPQRALCFSCGGC